MKIKEMLLALILVAVSTGVQAQDLTGVRINSEPTLVSGGIACDTLDQVKLAIDDLFNPNIPYPNGCVIIPRSLPMLAMVYLLDDYTSETRVFHLARYEITHAATPKGLLPFTDTEGNPEAVIKYGWWGSDELKGSSV